MITNKAEITNTADLITNMAEILCPDLALNWTSSFKLLGLEIDSKLERLHTNIEKKIIKVKSLITLWEKRNLTTSGRVAIAKSLLLSQLVYPMQVLDLTQENLDEIENILFSYIKGKTKRNWLSKEQIRTPKKREVLASSISPSSFMPKNVL